MKNPYSQISYKIVLLGAGNLGTHLAKALSKTHHKVIQVYSQTEEHAKKLADKIDCTFTTDINDILKHAAVYILTVKDDAIEKVSQQLEVEGKLVIHTSGTIPLNILGKHASHGVLYPVQTFSRKKKISFKNLPVCIEGNNDASLQIIQEIASSLSKKTFNVDSQQRSMLHISAVFASNFTNHLYTIAEDILKKNKLSLEILHPLIKETVKKAIETSPAEVQTGPAIRKDKTTIERHLAILNSNPDYQKIYKLLTENIGKGIAISEELPANSEKLKGNKEVRK